MVSQTINISLPRQLVQIIDRFAKNQFSTRSDLIRSVLVTYINKEKSLQDLFLYGQKKAKELGIKEEDLEEIIDEVRIGK